MNYSFLPSKKLFVLVVILALVNPILYIILNYTTPKDHVFVGYTDDIFQLTLMKSLQWNFQDPWGEGWSVYSNPVLGASYTFTILGTIPTLIGINTLVTFIVIKFFLSFIYLIVIYNVIKSFLDPKTTKIAYVLFLLSAGIGWLIYGASSFVFGQQYTPIVGYAFTSEFEELGSGTHALSHLTRIYWLLPEITGLLAILFIRNKKKIKSGIMLGLTFLLYPTFGFAFMVIVLLYLLVKNFNNPIKPFIKNFIFDIIPILVFSLIFSIPWILASNQSPDLFNSYKQWFSSEVPITIVISLVFVFVLSLFFFKSYKTLANNKFIIFVFTTLVILLSIAYLFERSGGNTLMQEWLNKIGLTNIAHELYKNIIFIELPLFTFLLIFSIQILFNKKNTEYNFILLWSILIICITIVSAKYVFWWPARMKWFLLLPLSMSGALGLLLLKEKIRFLTTKRILLIIVILSIPSMIGFNIWQYRVAHINEISYLSISDFNAISFLEKQEAGRVMSSYKMGYNIPYISNQRSILYNSGKDNKSLDVELFYSKLSTPEVKLTILKKYNIRYVFYGKYESILSNNTDLSNISFLKEIYSNENKKVYKTIF